MCAQTAVDTYLERQIPYNVRLARRKAGMSQRDLAERLNYSNTTISKIETGRRRLTIDELFHLAQVLDEPISFFLDGAFSLASKRNIIIECKTVERVAIPVWNKIGLHTQGTIVCYAYFNPEQIKGRDIVGLWFKGVPLDGEVRNGDVIFFDTLSELTHGRLILAIMHDVPVIMRCVKRNDKLALEYSQGLLSPKTVDIKGVIIEIRRWLV